MIKNIEYKSILIVEDNIQLNKSLADYFSQKNNVVSCETLLEAIHALKDKEFDIILLDVILPDGSGLKVFEYSKATPVVILSDLGSDDNLLDGFSAGALDYIVKPASIEIIEARMSLRLLPESKGSLSSHKLVIDMTKRTAKYENIYLNLTSSEFNILMFLMQNAGTFFTASEIYEKIWKMPYLNTTTIKTLLSNLRKKMMSVSKSCADLIITEFGKGYAFIGGTENA